MTLIEVNGVDAEKFLQGQLTVDVRHATSTHSILAAHCNPKGRIVSLFWLFKKDENFYLALPKDLLEIALKNLQKYAVFSKGTYVGLAREQPDINGEPLTSGLYMPEQRLCNIRNKIPTVYAATSGLFLPHDIDLPKLGGVSFTKGCYTGQEIIARMQHLGKPKQQLYQLNLASETIPLPGQKIYLPDDANNDVGIIVDAIKTHDAIEILATMKIAILENKSDIETQLGALKIISSTFFNHR